MDGQNELLTIAEIAIGIAGFAGVISVFAQRGHLSPADRLRFLGVISTAFSALLLAFVPIALAYTDLQQEQLWQTSSIVMLLWTILGLAPVPLAVRTIRLELNESSWVPLGLFLIPTVANLFVQLANSGSWFWQPNFIPYLMGMLAYLYNAGLFFVFIVLLRPPK